MDTSILSIVITKIYMPSLLLRRLPGLGQGTSRPRLCCHQLRQELRHLHDLFLEPDLPLALLRLASSSRVLHSSCSSALDGLLWEGVLSSMAPRDPRSRRWTGAGGEGPRECLG